MENSSVGPQESGSGLYTGPSESSFRSNEQILNSSEPTPQPSQNEINLNNFNAEEKTVPTLSNVAADGNRYYNSDLHYDPETSSFEPHKAAQEAPENASYMVATAKVAESRDLHQEALDSNKKANEGFIPMKPNPEITKALHVQDMIAELAKENARLKEQKELTPEQKQIQELRDIVIIQSQQIEQLVTVINQNNITINQGTPAATSQPVVETPRPAETPQPAAETPRAATNVNPELAPTTAAEAAERRDNRRKLKVAYIAGAVIGGSTGILGGVPAAGIGALACIAGGLLNTGLTKFSEYSINRWNRRLETVTDPAERAKLEKRVANWTKVQNFANTTVNDFLRGARHGLLASSIFSGVFLGSHGLAWNTGNVIPGANPAGNSGGNAGGTESASAHLGGGTESEPFDSGLIQNGRVRLPGDVSDGNLATGPVGNLPGGAENFSNFAGGQSDRGFWQLNNLLNANHIKADTLSTSTLHRMGYALQQDPHIPFDELMSRFNESSTLQ